MLQDQSLLNQAPTSGVWSAIEHGLCGEIGNFDERAWNHKRTTKYKSTIDHQSTILRSIIIMLVLLEERKQGPYADVAEADLTAVPHPKSWILAGELSAGFSLAVKY